MCLDLQALRKVLGESRMHLAEAGNLSRLSPPKNKCPVRCCEM